MVRADQRVEEWKSMRGCVHMCVPACARTIAWLRARARVGPSVCALANLEEVLLVPGLSRWLRERRARKLSQKLAELRAVEVDLRIDICIDKWKELAEERMVGRPGQKRRVLAPRELLAIKGR